MENKKRLLGWLIVICLPTSILLFIYGNPLHTFTLGLNIVCLMTIIICVPLYFQIRSKIITENATITAQCGHQTKTKGSLWDDKEKPYEVNLVDNPKYCLDCLKKAVIICPWCKGPIFPHEPITLATPTKADYKIPQGTVVFNKKPLQLVGCARCADTGADYAGYWVMPGKVLRQKSLLEIAAETGGVVMSNNLANPNEPVSVFREENGKMVESKIQR